METGCSEANVEIGCSEATAEADCCKSAAVAGCFEVVVVQPDKGWTEVPGQSWAGHVAVATLTPAWW